MKGACLPFLRRCRTGPLVRARRLGSTCRYTTAVHPAVHLGYTGTDDKRHDDRTLRRVFDSHEFWKDFKRSSLSLTEENVGLCQNKFLTSPAGFLKFASDIRAKCEGLVGEIVNDSSGDARHSVLQKFDLLSDYLCRVLDLADFVRSTHSDPRFQQSATDAYLHLWEYMNILNTSTMLKDQLQKILADSTITSTWSEEQTRVAHSLMKDFSNSAINRPQDIRQRFVDLSNDMKRLGSQFLDEMGPASSHIQLKSKDVAGMDPTMLKKHTSRMTGVSLPVGTGLEYHALSHMHSENARDAVYAAMRTVPPRQIATLEKLLRVRSEIAKLSDFSSYAEMNLADKMARSPNAVDSFLRALSADNAPYVHQEINALEAIKHSDGSPGHLQPRDVLYYQARLKSSTRPSSRPDDEISAYFSLGTVMQGLSRLFDRLYGIRFAPCPTGPGETWDPNVRRLNVVHETEGHLAVLYCDLFQRAGKAAVPTHFTLRCARQISTAELADTSLASHDGMARSKSPHTGHVHQIPTIALICDFPVPAGGKKPVLLSFQDVQTLFHEMGHAIHSVCGRTSLQILSGTRCVTDFAELPSVLMENFAADQSVLGLFARHWQTDAPLPFQMVQESLRSRKRFLGMQTQVQILYSLLDQAYHSQRASAPDFDSTAVFYDVYDAFSSFREPRGISPQGFFGHLVEYGGTYYSYLFDRAIAGKIWRQVFRNGERDGGIDRGNGERFRDAVLKWGGARDPWRCIGDVLQDEQLAEGGKEAMEKVGQWGVHT